MRKTTMTTLIFLLAVSGWACNRDESSTRDVSDLSEDYVADAQNTAKSTEEQADQFIEQHTGETAVDPEMLEKAISAGELARKMENEPEDQHAALLAEAGMTKEQFTELLHTIGASAPLREAFEEARAAETE